MLTPKEKKRDYDRRHRAANREHRLHLARAYRALDPEKWRAYHREWRTKNREKTREYNRRWKTKDENRQKCSISAKEYRAENPTAGRDWAKKNPDRAQRYVKEWIANGGRIKVREWEREKYAADLSFRIGKNLRTRLRGALLGRVKTSSAPILLGCSIQNFILYIESKFEQGMAWENYGSFWEIDHILPCALFDLTKEDHQKRCFHFSNQQPLTVHENRVKHTKLPTPSTP